MKHDVEKLKSHWLEYESTGSFIPLLVFLEFALAEVREVIASNRFEPFPFRRLIEFAVTSEAEYWARLAVDWLEQGFPVDEKIANAVKIMVDEERNSQKTRERALSLVKGSEGSSDA